MNFFSKNITHNKCKLYLFFFILLLSLSTELLAQDPLVIDPSGNSTFHGNTTVNGNSIVTGKLGIGTAAPTTLLHLNTDSSPFATSILGKGNDANFKIITYQDRSANKSGSTIGGFGLDYKAGTKNALIRFHRGGSPTGGFMTFTTNNNSERLRITSDGKVGVGNTIPIAKLDIMDKTRTSTHPSSIKGLYVTGDFGHSSDGVEFRHTNGTQGLGFGYNSIYAAGSQPDQHINILPKGIGNVGIGESDPQKAKLEINGSVQYPKCVKGTRNQIAQAKQTLSIHKFQYETLKTVAMKKILDNSQDQYDLLTCSKLTYLSIYASNSIRSDNFVTASDARIKNILGRSNSQSDLNTLGKIEITDYRMKDQIAYGQKLHKKVIAQQVQEVFPEAVMKMEDVIPDIYQLTILENGWIPISPDVKVGDKVRLIFGQEAILVDVLEVSNQGFRVDSDRDGEVFVYGRQVDDFHIVDYDAISMLNVSATQELLKKIEQLEEEKTELKSKYDKLNDRLSRIEASLEQ